MTHRSFRKTLLGLLAISMATLAPGVGLTLDIDISPTPVLGVEKTYEVTIVNTGRRFASDLSLPAVFELAVTLASEPTAEYFAYLIHAESSGVSVETRSMLDWSIAGYITFPGLDEGGDQFNGLTVHPSSGQVYAIYEGDGCGNRCLFRLNLSDGTYSNVGNMGDYYVSLAFDKTGSLWTSSGGTGADDGANLKVSTKDASVSGVEAIPGLDNSASNTLAYNPDTNRMYFFNSGDTDGTVWTYDPGVGPSSAVSLTTNMKDPENDNVLYAGAAQYIGNGKFIVADSGYGSATNILLMNANGALTKLFDDDGLDAKRGLITSGNDQPYLSCTGTGADMECSIPKLIPGGKIVLNFTGTLYAKPTPTAEPEDANDTTVPTDDTATTADGKGGGGCAVAAAGSASSDIAFALFAFGAFAWTRRRLRRS